MTQTLVSQVEVSFSTQLVDNMICGPCNKENYSKSSAKTDTWCTSQYSLLSPPNQPKYKGRKSSCSSTWYIHMLTYKKKTLGNIVSLDKDTWCSIRKYYNILVYVHIYIYISMMLRKPKGWERKWRDPQHLCKNVNLNRDNDDIIWICMVRN